MMAGLEGYAIPSFMEEEYGWLLLQFKAVESVTAEEQAIDAFLEEEVVLIGQTALHPVGFHYAFHTLVGRWKRYPDLDQVSVLIAENGYYGHLRAIDPPCRPDIPQRKSVNLYGRRWNYRWRPEKDLRSGFDLRSSRVTAKELALISEMATALDETMHSIYTRYTTGH